MSQGFSTAALRSYEPIMLAHIKKLCKCLVHDDDKDDNKREDDVKAEKMPAKWSSAKNMSQWCKRSLFLKLGSRTALR